MRIAVLVARVLVGSLFIVSGLIKANDALGFMYKLEEYFEPGALNLPGLTPFALGLGMAICAGEILLGVALLVGALPRLTAVLTGIMMAFFTWLTWYTTQCDPNGTKWIVDATGASVEVANQCVLSCGCFGNAIPLTPYESFLKDVVLSVLTLPILWGAFAGWTGLNERRRAIGIITASLVLIYGFSAWMLDWMFPVLFAAIAFLVAEGIRSRVSGPGKEWAMAAGVLLVCLAFQFQTYRYLPLKDYTAYAPGKSIPEQMKTAQELGLQPPVYAVEYTFRNKSTGQDTIVLSSDWMKVYHTPWFQQTYEQVSFEGEEVEIQEGYTPPIQDLQFIDAAGEDVTRQVLTAPGYLLVHVSQDVAAAGDRGKEQLQALETFARDSGWRMLGVSNLSAEENAAWAQRLGVSYPMYSCDQTELKILVRSNPGLLLLHEGVVVDKWSGHDLPEPEDLKELLPSGGNHRR
jgi:uncharacterized membrane protein YphA (DoxX/SURF4 family)